MVVKRTEYQVVIRQEERMFMKRAGLDQVVLKREGGDLLEERIKRS